MDSLIAGDHGALPPSLSEQDQDRHRQKRGEDAIHDPEHLDEGCAYGPGGEDSEEGTFP